MASVMGICGGLVGPDSGNAEKVLAFQFFFEGSRDGGVSQECKEASERGRLEVE